MATISFLIILILVPLTYLFDGSQRVFMPYLIMAFIPVMIAAYRANNNTLDLKQIADFCFPEAIWKHPSSRVDRWFFVVNTIFFTTLLAPYVASAVAMNEWMHDGLTAAFGEPEQMTSNMAVMTAIATVLFILVSDFAIFLAHYLQHKVPFLWEFHKVHHSAQVMTPITVYRMHPVDDALAFILGGILNGGVIGALHYGFAQEPSIMQVSGLSIATFIFYLSFYNLRHSHFWLHYGRLGHVFISPAMHQIHHSEARKHWDKNMGFIFSFWDKLFGTLYVPEVKEELTLGIGPETEEYNSVWNLYTLPFKKNWRRVSGLWHSKSYEKDTDSTASASASTPRK